MKTIVYISRHSEPFRNFLGEYNVNEIEQIRNEKNPLSVNGEKKAEELSNLPELNGVEVLYSSHYVRAMATAKYIAEHNNIKLNVDERLGERKFGVMSMKELPETFFEDQFTNWDYKLPNGESLNEVAKRMQEFCEEILAKHKGSTIMIISHGTALTTLFKKWCDIKFDGENNKLYFNGKEVFDGKWKAPQLFKLEFNNDILTNIKAF